MSPRNLFLSALSVLAFVAAGALFALRPRLDKNPSSSDAASLAPRESTGPATRPIPVAPPRARVDALPVPPSSPVEAQSPPASRGEEPGGVPTVPGMDRPKEDPRTYGERVQARLRDARLDPNTARRLAPVMEGALRDFDVMREQGAFSGAEAGPEHRRWATQVRRQAFDAAPGIDWAVVEHAFPELR